MESPRRRHSTPTPRRCQIPTGNRDPSPMDEIDESLDRALDRIDQFRMLQNDRPDEGRLEAVLCLQEAVGIGEQTRDLIRERLYEEAGSPGESNERPGAIFLGLIVGLLAAQLEAERPLTAGPFRPPTPDA